MVKTQWLWLLETQVTCPVFVSLCVILCSIIWTEGRRETTNRCDDLKPKKSQRKLQTYIYCILFNHIGNKTQRLFRKTQIHCYLFRDLILWNFVEYWYNFSPTFFFHEKAWFSVHYVNFAFAGQTLVRHLLYCSILYLRNWGKRSRHVWFTVNYDGRQVLLSPR